MPNNKLSDLNNHLFAQLERLGEEDLSTEQLKDEVSRAKAICDISKNIVASSKLSLDAMKWVAKGDSVNAQIPKTLQID